jgi:hypothetical protein
MLLNHLVGITAIVGDGDDNSPGSMMGRIAAKYQIPCILTMQPDLRSDNYTIPLLQNTTFLMFGPTYRIFKQAVDTYMQNGAKTVVAVANENYDFYNKHSCFNTADLLAAKGVKILRKYLIRFGDDSSRVADIVREVKALNPDGKLSCTLYMLTYLCCYMDNLFMYMLTYVFT